MTYTVDTSKRSCINCSSNTTSIHPNGKTERWYRYENGFICHKCRHKLIDDPKHHPINTKKSIPRRLAFKGKRLTVSWNLRKGKCEKCLKKIGDEYINHKGLIEKIKRTSTHHWYYLVIMPWACIVEVCMPCHRKIERGVIS